MKYIIDFTIETWSVCFLFILLQTFMHLTHLNEVISTCTCYGIAVNVVRIKSHFTFLNIISQKVQVQKYKFECKRSDLKING